MSLVRHWYGTSNYSYSNLADKDILVLHTTEGWGDSPNGMYDCIKYFQGNVGASSQVAIDAFHPGHICEGVSRANGAWTQCDQNYRAISAEQCGYAAWSREEWLGPRESLLRNAAAWLAEEHLATGIPLVELSESNSRTGRGVTFHMRLGSGGCGHGDPGNNYPLREVLQWAIEIAGGGAPSVPATPPEEDEDEMPYLHVPRRKPIPNSDQFEDAVPIDFKLGGWYKKLWIGGDASGHGNVSVRAAFHKGNNVWRNHNVYVDAAHNSVGFEPKDGDPPKPFDFDLVRIDRLDTTQAELILYFAK